MVFSIHFDPLLVVLPQRGYRIKPTHNQKNAELWMSFGITLQIDQERDWHLLDRLCQAKW